MATVTLLQLKSDFYRFQGEHFNSTATGGGANYVTDSSLVGYASETFPTKLEGVQLRLTSGSASGDLRLVSKVDRSEGIMYANRALSASAASTDTYELWGTAINGGAPLTNLFNDVTRGLRPLTETQVDIVSHQRHYTVTTLVQTKRDIRRVYVRHLDTQALEPYRIQEVQWTAHNRGGAGTTSVTLELADPLMLDTDVRQLWVQHETSFTAFSTDTSTVDAVYRDWLAWEAVLELCRRKLMGNGDRQRWNLLQERAVEELASLRARWIPQEPIRIRTF